jgi:hypothetical protein
MPPTFTFAAEWNVADNTVHHVQHHPATKHDDAAINGSWRYLSKMRSTVHAGYVIRQTTLRRQMRQPYTIVAATPVCPSRWRQLLAQTASINAKWNEIATSGNAGQRRSIWTYVQVKRNKRIKLISPDDAIS